jgi:nuclear pore complex protein Nup188
MQWTLRYNGWDVLIGEVQLLLSQVSYGAGTVQNDSIHKVSLVCQLVAAVLATDGQRALVEVPQLEQLIDGLYRVVHRFCVLTPAPVDLLASCLDVFTQLAPFQSQLVWHNLQQTGLLPFVTMRAIANVSTNAATAMATDAVESGAYGSLLAGHECIVGKYSLTESLLKLVTAIIENTMEPKDLTPFLLFLSQQIFPVLHKWRYHDVGARARIGQKCLDIFSRLLSIHDSGLAPADSDKTSSRDKTTVVRDMVVQHLLHTEASRTLFDIVRTGVDAIEASLATQGSASEGSGIELIDLVCLALSVLDRVLQLWPESSKTSASLSQSMSSAVQAAGMTDHHLVSTVAQYIYHRHSARLPCLATRLLTTLAQMFPMSMLACLGNEAEAIRDIYLARLQASTEDVDLKVVVLKWLATCVYTQPGVIEMFLNIQFVDGGKGGLSADKASCLQALTRLISAEKQGKYQCPAELLLSATVFVHALWKAHQQTALTVLRQTDSFWRCLCLCLHVDIPATSHDDDTTFKPSQAGDSTSTEVKIRANVCRILALELYQLNGAKPDEPLVSEIKSLIDKKRFIHWSQYLSQQMCVATVTPEKSVDDHATLHLLLSWRDLLIMFATSKTECISFDSKTKQLYLSDLLTGIEAQFRGSSPIGLRQKLASNATATYFIVLRHWCSDVMRPNTVDDTLQRLRDIMQLTCNDSEIRVQSVQVALLSAVSLTLQNVRMSLSVDDVDVGQLASLLPVVCNVVQMSLCQLDIAQGGQVVRPPPPGMSAAEPMAAVEAKLKLPIVAVNALQELIVTIGVDLAPLWLPCLKQNSIIQCLLSTASALVQTKLGISLVESILKLFLTMSRSRESAEALSMNRLNEQLCVPMSHLYADDIANQLFQVEGIRMTSATVTADCSARSSVYRLYVTIMSDLLVTLCNSFVAEAISFIGVHQQRMHQCLDATGHSLNDDLLQEANETCHLLACLSPYQRDWRLHLPASLQLLMSDVCAVVQVCAGLMIRPSLLLHLIEKQSKDKSAPAEAIAVTTSLSRHLLQQSSVDETDFCAPELVGVQHRLLNIICQCLVALRHFSPDLRDLLLSQTFDVSQYDVILAIGFGAPSVDKQQNIPTFGTFVAIINLCLKLLPKIEGIRLVISPQKSPLPSKPFVCDSSPIQRPMVIFLMENALMLIMTQVMRCLRDPALSQRDKQLLKRELSAELNSFLAALQRHLRSASTALTPVSPQVGSGRSSLAKLAQTTSPFSAPDQSYFRMVDIFVRQVLR